MNPSRLLLGLVLLVPTRAVGLMTPTPTAGPTPVDCDTYAGAPADGLCEWMSVGGPGPRGDCMMEWMLQTPKDFVPSKHKSWPRVAKLDTQQTCHDGDPSCDLDPAPYSCGFRVAMCFCVDDQAVTDCSGRRAQVCPIADPTPMVIPEQNVDAQYIGFEVSRPTASDRNPGAADSAHVLHDALLSCVTDNSGMCDPNGPLGCDDPEMLACSDINNSSCFAQPCSASASTFKVQLRKPLQYPTPAGPQQGPPPCVVNYSSNALGLAQLGCTPCSPLQDIHVPLFRKGIFLPENSIALRANFIPDRVDRGRDFLTLKCQRCDPSLMPSGIPCPATPTPAP